MSEFLDTSPLSEYEKRLLLLIWEHGAGLSSGRPGRGIDRRRGSLNDDPG